ncbi:MAG: type II secretion system protein [Alphaproteobacteria bacterium]
MKSIHESIRDEKGFTLVELAVVMVIVGLLIGGILKGQEMIANQQVNSTIAQIKSVDAAQATFRDIYDALPGDMVDALTRVTGCVAPCANGDGDNTLETAPMVAAPDAEALNFSRHLAGAGLVAGSSAVDLNFMEGTIRDIEFIPGTQAAAALGQAAAGVARSGNYLGVNSTGGVGNAVGLTPLQAGRIDRKLDDGVSNTGGAIAGGTVAACANAAGAYLENLGASGCTIAILMQ